MILELVELGVLGFELIDWSKSFSLSVVTGFKLFLVVYISNSV